MCGIVGILGTSPAAPLLVDALKRLEYRGYDSAGVATLENGVLTRRRAPGKLRELENVLEKAPLSGHSGIGHTRWATHGAPTEGNAHPHAIGKVSVVHNGIIENFRDLKEECIGRGVTFETDTDTEVVAALVSLNIAGGMAPKEAVETTLSKLQGAFALAFLFEADADLLIGARRGSPLAVGHGDGEMFLGSDAIALAPFTNRISYLVDGDYAVVTRGGVSVFDDSGAPVEREVKTATASAQLADKGNYRHFMAKEIYEQPEVISHTLGHYIDMARETIVLPDAPFSFADLDRLSISACGTAFYAANVARYWFERFAKLPVDLDIASEFRYREVPMEKGGLALFVSQSGETADTLATLRYCKDQGQHIGAIVNVPESTIARESDVIFPTLAGPEIGVASTKAFTCQLAVLACLAVAAGRERGVLDADDESKLVNALVELPRLIVEGLKQEPVIEGFARDLARSSHVLYLGRSTSFPIAMEGALKLKEISYIHAEGYAAGELKHGPIALIDEDMPVIVIAPYDRIFEKTASNMEEVAARGGRIILITDEKGAAHSNGLAERIIEVPDAYAFVTPILYAIPVQLIAYHTAVFMGTDVDQPRNLAKSVTVE